MVMHSSILAWEIPRTEEPTCYTPWGRKESDMTERLNCHHSPIDVLTLPSHFDYLTFIFVFTDPGFHLVFLS